MFPLPPPPSFVSKNKNENANPSRLATVLKVPYPPLSPFWQFRHWLWRQGKAWRGFYMSALAEGGLLLTTFFYISDVLIILSALGLAVTFIYRANWPPTMSDEM